jgi:DNA relaxase NicK
MGLFGILKSKAERDFELKSRLRQANNKIEHHVRKLERQCGRYLDFARRAFDLQDAVQFSDLAKRYYQTLASRNRWQRYQLKLNSMELQRDEVRATEEFLSGIGALTQAILQGVDPKEVKKVARDIELAESKCQELDQSMTENMFEVLGPVSGDFDEDRLRSLSSHLSTGIEEYPLAGSKDLELDGLPASRGTKMSFEDALNHYRDAR